MFRFSAFCALACFYVMPLISHAEVEFSTEEITSIVAHGPWPNKVTADPSNALSGNAVAIEFGAALFFDAQLSGNKNFSCASCHQPQRYFTDGLSVSKHAEGKKALFRNTPSLFNLAGARWLGWGGDSDSLWSHTLLPLLAENEMAATPRTIKSVIHNTPRYAKLYQRLHNSAVRKHSADQVMVNIAKAIAAYQETLISARTSFDEFRDALLANDKAAQQSYPDNAKRGLKTFVGEGRCNFCHFGANFSSGEFADIGIPFLIEGGVDAGRYTGIQRVKTSAFNLLGKYNDADAATTPWWTNDVTLQHKNWGEFKVPSLRNSQFTAPYMHNGSLATLEDVVLHYDQINEERLHADGEKILRPLNLTQQQRDDLLAFLRTL